MSNNYYLYFSTLIFCKLVIKKKQFLIKKAQHKNVTVNICSPVLRKGRFYSLKWIAVHGSVWTCRLHVTKIYMPTSIMDRSIIQSQNFKLNTSQIHCKSQNSGDSQASYLILNVKIMNRSKKIGHLFWKQTLHIIPNTSEKFHIQSRMLV